MRVRCPACQSTVALEETSTLSNVHCESCGFDFDLPELDTLAFITPSERSANVADRIDKYRLIQRLGIGAFGEVWRAHDDTLNRDVALKLTQEAFADETTWNIIIRLNHPGIARVYDAGRANGNFYVAQEYIEGLSLNEWSRTRQIAPTDAATICAQLSSAVAHAHGKGIIHRDLKPANIVIDASGAPHIIDFGTVRRIEQPAEEASTMVGTIAYMSPEQIRGDVRIDGRADIYSIGVVLYELLTGRLPFSGGLSASLGHILNDVPNTPRSLNSAVSRELEAICLRCLQKLPARRYSSALELEEALNRYARRVAFYHRVASAKWHATRWFVEDARISDMALLGFGIGIFVPLNNYWDRITLSTVLATVVGTLTWCIPRFAHPTGAPATESRSAEVRKNTNSLSSKPEVEDALAERTKMFLATKAELELYQSLVESLPLCVYRTDHDGRFVFANEFFCKTFAPTLSDVNGKHTADLFASDIAEKHQSEDRHILATGKVVELAEVHRIGDEPHHFDVLKSPVRNFRGEIVGIQGLMWDVSAHAMAEEKLREAKDAAEAASRAKTEFVANMSHEVRTPMTAIIGLTELVSDTEVTDTQREFLSMVHESASSLLSLINDVLDFSKIEAGKLNIDSVPFDIRYELDAALKALKLRAEDKSLTLSIRVDSNVPNVVKGDSIRLRQVIVNLVGNAIKFTEKGAVDVLVAVASQNDRRVDLHFVVSDTGIGIPPDKRETIFDAFVQADTTTTRKHGGTGLGLAIASQLVKVMRGRIWVESEIGVGSQFHFTTIVEETDLPPATSQNAMLEPAESLTAKTGLRILVTDDTVPNQILIQGKLTKQGHRVDVAASGQEALSLLEQCEFDVVLMDVQMPGMDGFEVTKRIRAKEEMSGRRTPIIAITAHAMPGDRERCLNAGMDGYIVKPINWVHVSAAIAEVLPETHVWAPSFLLVGHFLNRVNQDKTLATRLLKSFLDAYPPIMSDIVNAVRTEDAGALEYASHKLKGAIGSLLGTNPSHAVLNLESMAKQGAMLHAEREYRKLERFMCRLRTDIEGCLTQL